MKLLTLDEVTEDADARLLRRLERELAQGWPAAWRPELELAAAVDRRLHADELAVEARGRLSGRAAKKRGHLSVVA